MTIIIKDKLHPHLQIDHHTETTPTIDIILDHKGTPLDDIITRIDHHPDQEITDYNLEHPHKTDNKTE